MLQKQEGKVYKRWFNRNLKNEDLKEGDLALLYSISNTKRKLKYQGMGPYQVVEITPQWLVIIVMLDGVVMECYMNGSNLKRFFEPLTIETLQAIHKEQEQNKVALAYSKERARIG